MPIGVEGGRALRHRDAVPRYCVSHVVVVDQVCEGRRLQVGGLAAAGCHLAVDGRLDEVVFQKVGGERVDACS
jgi:hypothetical protein